MTKNILIENSIISLVILETATEDRITVYREARIRFTLGQKEIQATALAADIVDDFLFELDIMTQSNDLLQT